MRNVLIFIFILVAITFALGWHNKKREQQWNAYPRYIIADTPEDFQRSNTP